MKRFSYKCTFCWKKYKRSHKRRRYCKCGHPLRATLGVRWTIDPAQDMEAVQHMANLIKQDIDAEVLQDVVAGLGD